jgi:hypothetical protein
MSFDRRPAELPSIMAFYQATGGPGWRMSEGWLGADTPYPCTGTYPWFIRAAWYGVSTCSVGQVATLSLDSNSLTGTLPPETGYLTALSYTLSVAINTLSGTLPPSLGQLNRLREAGFHQNLFSGTLPSELAQLTQLRSLRLEHNRFSGTLPTQLARLTQLQSLCALLAPSAHSHAHPSCAARAFGVR